MVAQGSWMTEWSLTPQQKGVLTGIRKDSPAGTLCPGGRRRLPDRANDGHARAECRPGGRRHGADVTAAFRMQRGHPNGANTMTIIRVLAAATIARQRRCPCRCADRADRPGPRRAEGSYRFTFDGSKRTTDGKPDPMHISMTSAGIRSMSTRRMCRNGIGGVGRQPIGYPGAPAKHLGLSRKRRSVGGQ